MRILLMFIISLVPLLGCSTFSEEGEVVYLNAQTIPPLEIPADIQNTTSRMELYPVPAGERQTVEQGSVDPFPPDGL